MNTSRTVSVELHAVLEDIKRTAGNHVTAEEAEHVSESVRAMYLGGATAASLARYCDSFAFVSEELKSRLFTATANSTDWYRFSEDTQLNIGVVQNLLVFQAHILHNYVRMLVESGKLSRDNAVLFYGRACHRINKGEPMADAVHRALLGTGIGLTKEQCYVFDELDSRENSPRQQHLQAERLAAELEARTVTVKVELPLGMAPTEHMERMLTDVVHWVLAFVRHDNLLQRYRAAAKKKRELPPNVEVLLTVATRRRWPAKIRQRTFTMPVQGIYSSEA